MLAKPTTISDSIRVIRKIAERFLRKIISNSEPILNSIRLLSKNKLNKKRR